MDYAINKTWNGVDVQHDPIKITLREAEEKSGLCFYIKAPYFGDPVAPAAEIGPLAHLWDYEVVEMFFLNQQNQYLEVEISPSGHYLLLQLRGPRDVIREGIKLDVDTKVDELAKKWTGSGCIPWSYFPKHVTRFNAYTIHGSGLNRTYEALYPTPNGKFDEPDFHRLEYFEECLTLTKVILQYQKNSMFD